MRRELPSGTVTFLFTDVEGSTRLLAELGAEGYAAALAEHRRVLRGAFARHGGVEVDTQGDAFFVAFPTAPGALAAACEAQGVLAGGPIRVRMGLHTGTPLVTGEGYVGADVHRAARIAAAGHGGQVLVSASTGSLVDSEPLRDLGEHRFKDLAAPERVFQLGEGEFPPLRSLYRTNLPVPATPFLGRERELAEVVELLMREEVRLLTLTGSGGTGKTRLAVQAAAEAAERFPDGITWVPLAPLRDPALLLPTVAQALGVRDESGREPAETLAAVLAGKRALLLLDNAEHLLPGLVSELVPLRELAGPALLVTSRERLRVQGEHVYAVPSLSDPDGAALFLARARALNPTFADSGPVGELCARLDNLPLALELAAARTPLFPVEQLAERLGHRLDLLRGGRDADPRQQTLRATFEWSHDLLSAEELTLFRRLSVFAGGCSLEAAEAVCGADPDTLQSLLDKSLLRRRLDQGRAPRFWMLETIREYGVERLEESGEADEVRMRHARCFLGLAEEADREVQAGHDQAAWLQRLDAEHDNLRVALHWLAGLDDAESELRMAIALGNLWEVQGHFFESLQYLERALKRSGRSTLHEAKALQRAGLLAYDRGHHERATERLEASLAVARALGEGRLAAHSLANLALVATGKGNLPRATSLLEEAIELLGEAGDERAVGVATGNLGYVELLRGRHGRAQQLFEEAAGLLRSANDDVSLVMMLANLSFVAIEQGDHDRAAEVGREGLQVAAALGYHEGVWSCLVALAASENAPERAALLLGAAAGLCEADGGSLQPVERAVHERTVAALRRQLEESDFRRLWEQGAALSAEEAVATALSGF